jgi:hypothetical protein
MKTEAIIPGTRTGRIRLHLACIRRGGSTLWHFRGILREISEAAFGVADTLWQQKTRSGG